MPDDEQNIASDSLTARAHGPPVSINRHVIYVDENGIERAAVVHVVHNPNLVNLTYFTDGGPQVQTSVFFDQEGSGVSWRWPDHVS